MRSQCLIFVRHEWSCWRLFDPMNRRSGSRGFESAGLYVVRRGGGAYDGSTFISRCETRSESSRMRE